jgi:phage terminase large subunit GpA-like protein
MKAAQLGVTEAAVNRAFFTLDKLRRDVLYLMPTDNNATDFSKARFSIALSLSPYLRSLFTDTNAVHIKQTSTNTLYIRGAKGKSNLKSVAVALLVLDEVDEMDPKAVWLAFERLSGQKEGQKNVLGISTPTIPNYGIHKLFLTSTQEHYFFTCPHCDKLTELIWPDCFELLGETISDPRCKDSFIKCKECKQRLEHNAKQYWLANGVWVPSETNANPEEARGFYVNQLYSSTVSPGDLAIAYHRGVGDEAAMKEFHNSKLGLPFIGHDAQITDEMIDACIRTHSNNDLPPENSIITMGVDQGKWCHVSIVEWLRGEDMKTKDINQVAIAKLLHFTKFYEEDWDRLCELMRIWQIRACVIDADPQINEARRFARKFHGYVWLCRYRRGLQSREVAVTEEDTGSPMATVDRTNWMSATFSRFKTKPPRIWLPKDLSDEYREHIKSPVRTYEKDEHGNPRAVYLETGADHFAHSLNYAEIGLYFAAQMLSGQNIANIF